MIDLSIAITCFKPSKKSIENILIILDVINERRDVSLSYFLNGKSGNEYEAQLLDIFNNNTTDRCLFNCIDKNIGVGMGVAAAISYSNGRYVMLLGDDDLINKDCILYILNKSHELSFDIAHQYLIDSKYTDSSKIEKFAELNEINYSSLLAEIGFRSGALPGFIFKRELFDDAPHWKDKLYPWIEIVFSSSISSIALLSPSKMIEIDDGPGLKDRFKDRVPRGDDYGFLERLSYGDLAKSKSLKVAYDSYCYLWIIKISKSILLFSDSKYKSLMKANKIKFFFSQYFGKILSTKVYIILILLENPKILLQVATKYLNRYINYALYKTAD